MTFVSCFKELREINIIVQLEEDHDRYRDEESENGQVDIVMPRILYSI